MRSRRAVKLCLLALALAGVVFVWQVPHAANLLFIFGPVLAVMLPLVFGHYPGERQIARLAAAWRAPRRRRAPASKPSVRRIPPRLIPRGGRLIASSLAVRPPPAVLGAR